ncbi:transglycosylase domain-containing protein [Tuberibacillus calidus]|uniref:transglycosylase domain-containing protein n=1 Tax=Tuberibacillus calidus TaxID=340097 RepID=UPI0004226C41|nr:transglycosylase domain-containing protein [Tuberibacillus calidus]
MSFEPSKWVTYFQNAVTWLKEKKILKGFRIGSKVVWNLFLIFLSILVILGCFAFGLGAGYFASLVKDQPVISYETMKKAMSDYSETTTVYFAEKKVLGKLQTDLIRTVVPLEQVSPHFIDALLSTEDELFYEHHGVVPKAVFRAVFQELTNRPIVTGGSTITQQLVKNQILTNEVSFKRKAREILLAMRLENFFDKKDILNAYINIVPFGRNSAGQNVAGIEAASQGIFGVSAKDLNIPQAAFLAGLPKNPFVYSPFKNEGGLKDDLSAGIERAHVVLKRMLDTGAITKAEYADAMKYDYRSHFAKEHSKVLTQYPYLMTEVHQRAKEILAQILASQNGYEAARLKKDYERFNNLSYLTNLLRNQGLHVTIQDTVQKAGYDYDTLKKNSELFGEFLDNANKQLEHNGYKIYTTINKKIYDKMQEAALQYKGYEPDKVYRVTNSKTGEKTTVRLPMEVGAMLIDNKTGAIISFVGGRKDKYDYSQVNHATQTIRQNGSTMKPLLDYGPAIENGLIQPGTILADLPTTYPGNYEPHNYASTDIGKYHGFETARKALYESHNVPAIQVYWMNKQKFQPLDYLEKMGFSTLVYPDNGPLPVGIGGLTLGVTVEENTNAYTTFANGGNFVDAYMIDRIETNDGRVIYQHKTENTHVFSPQTSYLVIDMLRDVLKRGTAADIPGMLNFHADWFGKTGTSQDWHDSWFIAANPNITLGVWTGFDQQAVYSNGQLLSRIQLDRNSYHRRTSALWASFANAAYAVAPKLMAPTEKFAMPDGIERKTICGLTMGPVTESCKNAGLVSTDLVNTKTLPKQDDTNAFASGRYVILNNKKVPALPTTPEAFTMPGLLLSDDFIKTHFPYLNMKDIKSKISGGIIPVAAYKADDAAPKGIAKVQLNKNRLVWTRSSSDDVVGYRIYHSINGKTFIKIKDVVGGSTLSSALSHAKGYYYVTAVDITGLESPPSPTVGNLLVSSNNPKKGDTENPPTDQGSDDGTDANNPPTDTGYNGTSP